MNAGSVLMNKEETGSSRLEFYYMYLLVVQVLTDRIINNCGHISNLPIFIKP